MLAFIVSQQLPDMMLVFLQKTPLSRASEVDGKPTLIQHILFNGYTVMLDYVRHTSNIEPAYIQS